MHACFRGDAKYGLFGYPYMPFWLNIIGVVEFALHLQKVAVIALSTLTFELLTPTLTTLVIIVQKTKSTLAISTLH